MQRNIHGRRDKNKTLRARLWRIAVHRGRARRLSSQRAKGGSASGGTFWALHSATDPQLRWLRSAAYLLAWMSCGLWLLHGFGSGDCCAEGVRVLVSCLSARCRTCTRIDGL
jgi:hypothetical protein